MSAANGLNQLLCLDRELSIGPPFQVLGQRWSSPRAAVVLMIPDEHVISAYNSRLDGKGELVAVSGVGKEEKAIKWHIQLFELCASSKTQIVFNDAIKRPNKTETILAFDSVGL